MSGDHGDMVSVLAETTRELGRRVREALTYLDWTEDELHLDVPEVRRKLRGILRPDA